MKNPTDWFRKPLYDKKEHLAQVQTLYRKYELNTKENCAKWTDIIAQDVGLQTRETIHALFEYDDIYRTQAPTYDDRPYLTRQTHELSEERVDSATGTIVLFFRGLSLPQSSASSVTVPRHALIPDFREVIFTILGEFSAARYGEYITFPNLRRTLVENWHFVSGMDIERPSTKSLVPPTEYDGDPLDYLKRTPFYDFFKQSVPFSITHWDRHGIALGPSGYGKSQLVQSFIADRLPTGEGFWHLDPHGDSHDIIKDRVDPSRLVVINPDDPEHRPSLNFLDFRNSSEPQVLQTFSYLLSSLSSGLTDKQSALVPYLIKLLKVIPDATLETLRSVVDEKVKKAEQSQYYKYIKTLSPVDQGFFATQWFHSSMDPTKQSIAWKIYAAMASDVFRDMFASSQSTLDFDALLAQKKVVLVRGSRNSLGDDGMRIFLQFILAQYFAAALRRERLKDRPLNIMYVDEASFVLSSPLISSMCVEMRKYRCGLWLATQVYEQIGTDVRAAILGSVGTKICGPVSFSDANVLAREMNVSADFIRSMRAVDRSHADWAIYTAGLDRAVKVRVPFAQLEGMPTYKQQAPRKGPPPIPKTQKAAPEPSKASNIGAQVAPNSSETHEAPQSSEASMQSSTRPPEGDKPSVPLSSRIMEAMRKSTGDDPSTPGKGRG